MYTHVYPQMLMLRRRVVVASINTLDLHMFDLPEWYPWAASADAISRASSTRSSAVLFSKYPRYIAKPNKTNKVVRTPLPQRRSFHNRLF